ENFHFYTLNKPVLTRDICAAIGLTPQTVLQKVA
ncbi:MAG: 5,10-methylenetetrahydrofolate reductase, partial [Paracoccaceae bacterium]